MALLGSTVDPRLFVQDYSGFTRAADIQAQSMANLGGQIAGGIERYGEQKQERKKLDAGIKATVTGIESAIKMGKSLGIDVESSLTPYLNKINDPNVSPIEAAAYAQQASNSISNVLNFGMKANEIGLEKERYAQATATRAAELRAEAQKPIKLKRSAIKLGDETEVDVLEDDYGNVYDPQTKSRILDVQGFAKGLPLSQVTEQFDASGLPVAYGGEMPTETGEVLPSLAIGNVPTLSADAQAAADIGGAIYPDGVPVEGTPIAGAEDQIAAASQIAAPVVSPASAEGIQTALDITPPQPQTLTPRARTVKGEPKGEVVTQEEANRRTASGLSVTATPVGKGMVRITSQTGSPKPSPVIESPESKLQTQRLLELDKSLGSLREAGTVASLDVEPLKEITKLLDTNVKTGFGRETLMQAQKILGQDVSSEEEFQARVGAEAMKNIALTKGAISDREMDYFKTVLSPNMGKTTEGNKKIIEFRVKYANRANKIAKKISDLQKNKKDPYEIQEAVDKIISSESLLDNPSPKKTEVNQAAEDAEFLGGF